MSSWGTSISSNDTYADIYGEFFDLYNEGMSVAEISQKLIDGHEEIINDIDDSNNFWFALAKAQWECKQLDIGLLNRVRKIIEIGDDLEVWRKLGADGKDIKKRKAALDKFLKSLQVERPKAKAGKKKIIRPPVFEKGDCLTFKLENGNYGGAIVLEAKKNTEYGQNLIATTRINQSAKPTKEDFEKAEVLVVNYANWDSKPCIQWYLPIRHKQFSNLIEKIDEIEVQLDYDINEDIYGHVSAFDVWFIQIADQQFKSEETKSRPTTKLTLKKLTKKNKWKFW